MATSTGEDFQPGKERRVSFQTHGLLRANTYEGAMPTTIIGVMYFKAAPDIEGLRAVLRERLLKHVRFRSIPISSGKKGREQWVFKELALEDVDMNYHVQKLFENDTVSKDDIDQWAGQRYDVANDLTKPLWKFYLVPKLNDGRAAVITVSDHALTDGVALVEVLFSLVDEVSEKSRAPPKRKKKPAVRSPVRKARIFVSGAMFAIGAVLFKVKADTPNRLKVKDVTKPSKFRVCGSTDAIPMSKVKELKNAVKGATMNDILLTMLNLMVVQYFREEEPTMNAKSMLIRGIFPINARKRGTKILESELGNKFSLGKYRFIFDYKSRVDLLIRVKQQLDDFKASPAAVIGYKLAKAALPRMNDDQAVKTNNGFISTCTAMLSNVAGPQTEVALAGQPVDELCFYTLTPQGVYVGVLTYNGAVTATFAIDEGCETDVKKLTKHWGTEFDLLYEEVMAEIANKGTLKLPMKWF